MTDKNDGVLAVLIAEIVDTEKDGYSAAHLVYVRDRVAELLAADEEYDAAWAEDSVPIPNGCFARRRAAKIRRAAAIRAMRGDV